MTIPALFSARLALHPATETDLDTLWAIWREPEVRRYLFDDLPVTRDRAAEVLRSCLGLNDGLGLWTICLREDSSIVGAVGLMTTSTVAEFEPKLIGLVEPLVSLSPSVWGRGYGREALRTVVGYGFGALGLPKLVAVNDVPNRASARMLQALGFRVIGECDGPRYRLRTYELTRAEFVEQDPTERSIAFEKFEK